MTDHLDHVVYDFLRLQHIRVARSYLTKQLSSHPEPNSLLSITDTLDELSIPHSAVRIEKAQLPQIPLPFLAHLRRNNGQFVLIKTHGSSTHWADTFTGVVLVAEKPTGIPNKDNTRMLIQEKRNKALISALILSGLVLLLYPLLSPFNSTLLLFTLLSLLGLWSSILIHQKEAGIYNPIVDQLCSTEKTTDCNTVLDSKASNLLGWLKLSDLGLIYFSGQLLAIFFHIQSVGIFSLLAACALPLTLYSLYYQGIVLRKWCTLCLFIVAVLWLQFWVLFPTPATLQPVAAGLTLAAFVLSGAGWLLLKETILGKTDLEQQLYRAWRLKRDPQVFAHLIQSRRRVDDTPFENEIQLGATGKPVRLLAVFNPYCKPCAAEYRQLEELLAANSDWFSLSIRFTLGANGPDHRAEAVRYLLQYWKANQPKSLQQLLHDWFQLMNLDSFKATHPLAGSPDVEPLLKEHATWMATNKISGTPSLFLNGYEFPRQYTVKDLPFLKMTPDQPDYSHSG